MLSITRINAHGQGPGVAALAYLKATEYYVGKNGDTLSSSRWIGRGAAALDLSGDVDLQVMDHLAKGFGPDGATPLCRNAGEQPHWVPKLDAQGGAVVDGRGQPRGKWEGGHRVGFDLTFSSEKTFSLVYAMASPAEREELLAAHHRAVEDALGYMERQVETRRGKGGVDKLSVKGLVVSRHTHFAGRGEADVDGNAAWDPQIHSHCLVYGVAQGNDGQWSTFDAQALYEHKLTAGALYRSELAHGLARLGYGIDKHVDTDDFGRETGKVYFRVAGVPETMRGAFSKRRAAVLSYIEAHPGANAQAATLATRRSKDEPTYAELTGLWARAIEGMSERHPEMPVTTDQVKAVSPISVRDVTDEALLEKLHVTSAVFSRKDLIYHLAQEHVGQLDVAGIEREADQFLERVTRSRALVMIDPARLAAEDMSAQPGRRHTEDRYAARWVVDLEQELIDRARTRKEDATVRTTPALAEQAIEAYEVRKGFQMSDEQRAAVRYLANGSGGTAVLVGRAGAGKTTSVGAAVDAWRANGQHVIGVATAWKAAEKLEAETGVESHSVASLLQQLDRDSLRLTPKSVILLDEAGMVGTKHLVELQQRVDAAQGKLVLMGDPKQLQPVEWGGGLRLVQKENSAELTEIRRQSVQRDRETAQLFYELPSGAPGTRSRRVAAEQGNKIWAQLEAHQQIEGFDTKKDALEQLVRDVLNNPSLTKDKLVIGSSRADVDALTRAMRQGMKQRGELGTTDYLLVLKAGTEVPVARGERLAFTRRVQSLGVVNGTTVVVEQLRPGRNGGLDIDAVVESDIAGQHGRRIRWNTEALKGGDQLSPAYASTIHKAQGAGVSEVYQLANPGMADEQSTLTGFTRTKDAYHLYGSHDDLEHMAERYGMDRLALNAVEEGIRRPGRARIATLKGKASIEAAPPGPLTTFVARMKALLTPASPRAEPSKAVLRR